MSWRAVVKVVVGLAVGAICLVAWSSTSSAAEATPPPPPPGLLTTLTGELLPPVQQLTDQLGLGPVVNPVVDQVVAPTVVALDGTVATVGTTLQELPPLLGLPSGPVLPGPGQPQVPALPLPGPGTYVTLDPAGAASVPTAAGVAENVAPAPAGTTSSTLSEASAAGHHDHGAAATSPSMTAAADDGSSSPLSDSFPVLPAVLGIGGTALTSAAGSGPVGLALLAILSGVAATALTPVWRRLAALGLLTPRAMSFAIATRPG